MDRLAVIAGEFKQEILTADKRKCTQMARAGGYDGGCARNIGIEFFTNSVATWFPGQSPNVFYKAHERWIRVGFICVYRRSSAVPISCATAARTAPAHDPSQCAPAIGVCVA
jgi:hypothetical protein